MPNYLKEADWKAVLNKPKNLGLKAQKTGISEKLRAYEEKNKGATSNDLAEVQAALTALQALRGVVQAQATKHKAFTEATAYMKKIDETCGKREVELLKRITMVASLGGVAEKVGKAKSAFAKCKTVGDFTDTSGGIYQAIRALGADCSKCGIKALAPYGAKSGELTSNETLSALNDKTLAKYKKDVETFIDEVVSNMTLE